MASSLRMSTVAVNGMADHLARRVNGGKLQICSGSQPSGADKTITDQTILVEFLLPNPAFGEAEKGKIVCHEIEPTRAVASGKATWYRVMTAAGAPLWDGSVGESGCDMNISDTEIFAGAEVSLEVWEHLVPR